jgi:glycerol-3-phosphate acyltransferase PlsY
LERQAGLAGFKPGNNMPNDILWIIFAFLCGSLPLSYWVGRLFLHVDIREYGDGNPGGTNVWKAGGAWWGMLAIISDGMKGLVPVALAYYQGNVSGYILVFVSLAPILGHVYTPFLNFQGGKALATSFGVWTALTVYEAPVVLGLSLAIWSWLLRTDGWVILAGMLTLLVYLLVWHPDPVLISVWVGNCIILVWRYRDSLRKKPAIRFRRSS